MSQGEIDVLAERQRQIEIEGWTPEHDEEVNTDGELVRAAVCYAVLALHDDWWPWADVWWKPKNRRRDLVRAAALIIAEIDRLDRTGR